MGEQSAGNGARKAYYKRLDPLNMTPLWEVFHDLVTPEPDTACVPWHWSYAQVRPHLMEAGSLITAEEAVRRVLVLENPGMRGASCITNSLYAGLQLVLPGEVAPAHRHSQSALRLIIEGSGGYTSVDGEPAYMEKGDFIITGSWSWHDHGNDTSDPVVWLDGLDIPIVKLFDASFAESYPEAIYPRGRPSGASQARYGANMAPLGHRPATPYSPMFAYPYARSREALEQMRGAEEWDPCHGLKMEYINPVDGGPAMPTISAFLQLLPGGFSAEAYRSTDATVYAPIEGEGETIIGETRVAWQPGDVFVVPSWAAHRHVTGQDAVLFSFSDRGVQQKLGIWREDRSPFTVPGSP